MKPGPAPGVYVWRNREYHGIRAVASAAGVQSQTIIHHLDRHGHLDRLGTRHSANWPTDGRGSPKRPVSKFGRHWPSVSMLAREIGKARCTVSRWINEGDDDRLLAALMAADARKTAAALKGADMIDRFGKAAA